ncbi:MAG: M15 family metallopeptidase [Deltaproteobacteria bacterium]|jgi:LAS superfamily LD-carboxypeptidase LdcB|nr:M15 family metallopeptidase [Deltaproteobacteria bacterium]MBW2537907.1 M15 family metallopeptidase [Deltaproteobacteria bacterium]
MARWGSAGRLRSLAALALLGGVAWLPAAGCTSDDSLPGGTDVAGFDEDVDPAELEAFDGKSDGDPCANHPGGTLTGEDLLVIVNKEEPRQLARTWEAVDRYPIDERYMMPGRTATVRLAALEAFYELAAAAKDEADLDLGVRSAYRSFRTQCLTFNYKVEQYGLEHAAQFSARPGRSEHQLGMAIDITSASLGWRLTQAMGDSPEGIWLVQNAHRFGFGLSYPSGYEHLTGYAYEPWHWRYVGREAAIEMQQSGLPLIEYLFACERGDAGSSCPREPDPEFEPNEGFIGGSCGRDEDCESIGTAAGCLLEGYPGGHCSLPCTLSCPDRVGPNAVTFCVAELATDPLGACHSRCDIELFPGTGCRDGYRCEWASRPNQAGTAQVCLPE